MHDWYGIETEAEYRRREWQRELEAEARLARAGATAARGRSRQAPRVLARLRSLVTPPARVAPSFAPPRAAAAATK